MPEHHEQNSLSSEDGNASNPPLMMRLDDVLKRAGWVGTGGQAKIWIQDGEVTVNGIVETRRRKQIFLGDTVQAMGESLILDATFFDS
ncbi:RNA-binding S4 domain-containing protein [Stieleria sp. JC731]|uniref:RNA-binding S4 domain-containing protein n=1 Tax=Pirellulaceae TaxID=2691357 RepID=UPI003965607C